MRRGDLDCFMEGWKGSTEKSIQWKEGSIRSYDLK